MGKTSAPPRQRWQDRKLRRPRSASRAFEPRECVREGLCPTRLRYLKPVQRSRVAAGPAFDPQTGAEANKIGGRVNMLCGHELALPR